MVCGAGGGVWTQDREWRHRGGSRSGGGGTRVGGRLVVGELRVQEVVRGDGRVSYTVVDTDCSVVAEADGFLRACGAGTDRTYAYVLVDHLRWLRFAGLDTGAVSLEDLGP